MRRVRQNIELIYERLLDIGYLFTSPAKAFLGPSERAVLQLSEIEKILGEMPLSLRAFYEIVGTVDFRQSPLQHINYQ